MNPFKIYNDDPQKNKFYYVLTRNIAVIASIFSLIVCILIIANFIQIKRSAPLNLPQMQKLITQVQDDPDNQALKETVRELDLLTRKAYFSSLVFTRHGAFLLLGGVIVLLIALKIMSELKQKLPEPDKIEDEEEILEGRGLARWAIGGLGAAIVIVALMLPFFLKEKKSITRDAFQPIKDPLAESTHGNWPAFRGKGSIGVSTHTNIPINWNGKTGKGVLWKVAVPLWGVSSPVIWGKRLFVSGGDEDGQEVYCFHADTGEILWQKPVKKSSSKKEPEVMEDTGYAAPTMTTDGRYVFAIFATGVLTCFDFNGNEIWTRDLGVPDNHYGHASSLITYQDLLFIQLDQYDKAKILALKTDTGKTVWEQKRKVDTCWASPIVVNTGSRMEIILNANPLVISYDPKTGQKLWEVDCMDGEIGPSLAYANGIVFAANEYARLSAINIKTGKIIWETEDDLPEVSSPVAVKELLFMGNSGGIVTCLDLMTGKVFWNHEFDNEFYSSPVFAEDKIYLMDIKGIMYIFKADKKYKLISSCELGESSMITPAIVNGRIYIRGEEFLYCIGII